MNNIMKKTDNFINCETISYDSPIDNPDFLITDTTAEDLLFLSNQGYSIVIEKGKCTLTGDETARAKLITDELLNYIIDQDEYHELNDYVRFHCWSEDVLVNEVKLAFREAIMEKAYDVRFIDVLEYIADTWTLSDKEKDELKKQDAEYYQERKHPDDK